MTEQLSRAVQASAFITDQEMKEILRLQNQTRAVAYFICHDGRFQSDEKIPDADIKPITISIRTNFASPNR